MSGRLAGEGNVAECGRGRIDGGSEGGTESECWRARQVIEVEKERRDKGKYGEGY